MEHLTVGSSVEENPRDSPANVLPVHCGVAIPPHMPLPGQDGFRTPNVQDYEQNDQDAHSSHLGPTQDSVGGRIHAPLRTPPTSAGLFCKHSVNLNKVNLTLEALHWRERIRHFTWTFFTMTMATGGIANVLYSGILRKHDGSG